MGISAVRAFVATDSNDSILLLIANLHMVCYLREEQRNNACYNQEYVQTFKLFM